MSSEKSPSTRESKAEEEEVWKDDTPLKDVLVFVTKTYFSENLVLCSKWTEILKENYYLTLEHSRDISAEEWVAMKIPLRVRTIIRKVILGTEDDSEVKQHRRRRSRPSLVSITATPVKKAVSNSMITEFVGGVHSVSSAVKSTVGRIEFPKVYRATSETGMAEVEDLRSTDEASVTRTRISNADQFKLDDKNFSLHGSLPKSMNRSKSSKFQKILNENFWNADKDLNSPSSNALNTPPVVEEIIAGSVAIAGDSSSCTKLLNYFSFYSNSSFFCSGEKTIDIIVYEEKVSCQFLNCSRNAIEETMEKDVIILTFSIIDPTSLNNLLLTFMPLLKKRGYPKHLVYLVGIDSDKRDEKNRRHVSLEQTEQVLKNLRGIAYYEIGRLDTKDSSDNIKTLLQNCGRLVLSNVKSKLNKSPTYLTKFASIQKMINMQEAESEINLKKCRIEFVPLQIIFLRSIITRLNLSSNLIKFFPLEVLLIEGLLELDLSLNYISSIPNSIKKLSKLTHLNLESNKLEMLPIQSFQQITSLQELKLKGNPLSQVPKSFLNKKKDLLLLNVMEEALTNIIDPLFSPPVSPISSTGDVTKKSLNQSSGGSKNSALFGVPIEKIIEEDRKMIPHIRIPIFLQRAINFIITSGIDKQGIFRIEGNAKTIQELKESFDTGVYIEFMKFEDVNNVTSLLKLWLRSLPTPLLGDYEKLLAVAELEDENDQIQQLNELLESILSSSPIIYHVLCTVIRLCDIINKNNENNKMDDVNLSKVIATNLTRLPENGNAAEQLGDIKKLQDVIALLIQRCSSFFFPSKLSIFERDSLSDFAQPFASVVSKLSSNHKSITSLCICSTANGKRLWVGDDHGVISIWDISDVTTANKLVANLDAKKRINCLTAVNENVWVGCIENIQIRRGYDGELIKCLDVPGYNLEYCGSKKEKRSSNTINLPVSPSNTSQLNASSDLSAALSTPSMGGYVWGFLQTSLSQIKLFDIKRMKLSREFTIPSRVISIIKVPHKSEIWISCHDRKIYIYSSKSKDLVTEINTEHKERVTNICAVGKNEVWSSALDGIHVWDTATKELKHKITTNTELMGLVWTNDQVWAYAWDASIHVYNVLTKEFIGKLKSYHNQPISNITTYSPSNQQNLWYSFSSSYDHTVVIWQCRSVTNINNNSNNNANN